ncbi:MAG: MoaD/ThiS family protein [Candidatus Thorarchaeota archaeon]
MNKISLSLKLYGELRDKFSYKKIDAGIPYTIKIEILRFRTVLDIFKQLGIKENEVSHIFVNGIYSGAGKLVKDGDRIGIFPKRMGLIFLEITKIKSIYTKIIFHEELRGFGPTEAIIDLPEGSTINSVLNKYKLSKKRDKIEIIVNGKPIHNQDYIIKDWDNIAFFPL